MTEQKQPTARDIARKTLENKVFQGVLGSNQILENQALYGQLAVSGSKNNYGEYMNSEGVQKIRKELYNQKKEEGDSLGVHGFPSVNDYDVSSAIIKQIEENKSRLSLKDLGEVVKNMAGDYKYDFEVPKDLMDYIPSELQEKINIAAYKAMKDGKKINPQDALNEKEKDAMNVYQLLSKSYNRGASLSNCDYFADLNEMGKMIIEKYASKKEEE